MAGSGYNIPISVSVADSFSVPQSQNLPDYIIFGNAGKTGGDITANPQSYAPATAVSSAAEGNAASNLAQSGPPPGFFTSLTSNKTTLAIIAGSIVIAIVAVVLIVKKL